MAVKFDAPSLGTAGGTLSANEGIGGGASTAVGATTGLAGSRSGWTATTGAAAAIPEGVGGSSLLNMRVKSPAGCGAGCGGGTGGALATALAGAVLTESSQLVKSTKELMKSVTATGDP